MSATHRTETKASKAKKGKDVKPSKAGTSAATLPMMISPVYGCAQLCAMLNEQLATSGNYATAPMNWRAHYANCLKIIQELMASRQQAIDLVLQQQQDNHALNAQITAMKALMVAPNDRHALETKADLFDEVLRIVSQETGVSSELILGDSRVAYVVDARAIVIVVMRQFYAWSLNQIGRSINRDHTSVLNLEKRYGAALSTKSAHGKKMHNAFDGVVAILSGAVAEHKQQS